MYPSPFNPILRMALLAALLPYVTAFSCSTTVSSVHYNLNPLAGVKEGSIFTETPPTKSEARFKMELCDGEGLRKDDNIAEEDQCSAGTRLCLTLLNHKDSSDEPVRITTVIPIWPADLPDHDIELGTVGKDGKGGLNILVAGADFAGTTQHVNLTLHCSDTTSDPTFSSYTAGTLNLEWKSPSACPRTSDDDDSDTVPSGGGDEDEDGGGGGGGGFWGFIKALFWLIVLGLIGYFGIGIFYNHQQYSAKGWDLLPHRDFWREVPTMLSDLFAHLFAGLRGAGGGSGGGGSGRGGYSSLG